MVKIIKEKDYTDKEIRKANRILSQMSNVVDNAFSNFDTEWDSRPRNIDRKSIDGESIVEPFSLHITIGEMIFEFNVEISNIFAAEFTAPQVHFIFRGYNTRRSTDITPQTASSILAASKIAQRLKSEITQVLKGYGE